jgi:uncharacterized membrane protein
MLGGGVWASRDTGVSDSRLRELGEKLEPGDALLCALVAPPAAAEVCAALDAYGEVADAEAGASGVP